MKSIVLVSLTVDPKTDERDATAPGKSQGRFEAEWTDEGWRFGKRAMGLFLHRVHSEAGGMR
jgi:hypothetical protein